MVLRSSSQQKLCKASTVLATYYNRICVGVAASKRRAKLLIRAMQSGGHNFHPSTVITANYPLKLMLPTSLIEGMLSEGKLSKFVPMPDSSSRI